MQVRSTPPHRPWWKSNQVVPAVLVACLVLVASLLSGRNQHNATDQGVTTHKSIGSKGNSMFYEKSSQYSNDRVHRYAAYEQLPDGTKRAVTVEQWAKRMSDSNAPLDQYDNITDILKNSPFQAFRFETKGCAQSNYKKVPFEFALVDDPYLAKFGETADPTAFDAKVQTDNDNPSGVVFSNLGGDATLVVPKPVAATNVSAVYGHCANFIRGAPASQVVDLWKLVAQSYLHRLDARSDTVWLSTAGTGIAWLHFRLDDRPKYYSYKEFAKSTGD